MTIERLDLIDSLLRNKAFYMATYWCESQLCACGGCANRSSGLNAHGVTKDEWAEWLRIRVAEALER